MTAIATRDEANIVATHSIDDPTGGRLVAWAEAASAANQLAKALSQTQFVPKDFQGNVGNATAAILMGDELGLSPLAALRSIFVVHGTPAMYARTMVALAQSHGHQIWTEVDTAAKVIVCGQRKGSDKVERSEWTLDRARKAGYTGNKKYDTNPQEMLYAKAAATVARKVAADVLAGVPYTVEDLELEQPASTVTVTRSASTTKVKRSTEPEKVEVVDAEPDLEPEAVVQAEATSPAAEPTASPETGELITPKQLGLLRVELERNNMGGPNDRDAALAWMGTTVGREITTSKELTKREASTVIDALKEFSAAVGDGDAEALFGGEQ